MIPMVRSLLKRSQWMSSYVAGFITMALLAIFAVPVWAQAVAAASESGSSSIWPTIIASALAALGGLGVYIVNKGKELLDKLFNAIDRWLENKIENEFLEGALIRISSFGRMVAKDTFVSQYRLAREHAKKALADGKISKEEYREYGAKAKAAAAAQFKSITPKRLLDAVLGIGADESRVNSLASSVIEAAVHDLKIEGKLAKAAGGETGGK